MKKPAKKKNGISKNENEKYYRYIIENSEEAILLTRPDGTVEYANPEACKLFGRTEEEICNLGRNGIIDLNDPRLHIALEGRKRTGKFKGELNFVKKDGTIFPAEISSIIFKDEDGNERTSMVIRDITEEKEAVTKTQLLAHTITSITEIISITDLNDRFTFVNQAFCDIYGYTYEEIIGQHVKILVSPNNPPELLKNVLKHSHKDTWKGEILNLTKDGREFPISLQTSQIKNDKGEIIGLVGISEDITEQKRIEEVLRESEDRFRLLFERSAEAQLLLDDKGKVADCNNALLRLFALRDKETILGHGPDEFAPELQPNGTPSKDFGKIIYAKVLENGYAQFEWSHFKHNPERTPILNELICTLFPIQGRSFLHVAIRDITVRKKAEIALEESEYRFKTLSSLSNEGIMIHDKGVILDVNLAFARLLGYSNVDDLIGKDGFEITQLTPESKQNVLHHSQTNSDDTYEIELLNLNGKLISAETRASETPYKGINARIVYMRDISERKQADQSIRESEEKFKTVFEEARDGILIADIETKKFLTGNKMICQMLGYDEEEIRKIGIGDIHPENDLSYVLEQVEKQMKNKIQIAKDLPCKRKDGSIFYADVNAAPIIIKGKKYLLGIFRDITERKQAEEALRKSHDLLDTTFASLNDAVFILDDQAVVVECNRAASRIFGYRQDEIQGQTTAFLHVDESALAEFRQQLYSAIEAEGRLNQFEFRMKRRDGTIFTTEHSVIPLVNVQGRRSGWVSVVRDITERKKAEEKISMLAYAIRSISECVSITDMEDNILFVNKAFLKTYKYEEHELIGNNIRIIRSPNNPLDITYQILPSTIQGGWNGELLNKRKDGTEFPVFLSTSVIRDDTGNPVALIGITSDITERKHAEEEMNKLANVVNHSSELVNLATIDGKMIFLNEAGIKMLGISAAEVEQTNIMQVIPTHLKEMVENELFPTLLNTGRWIGDLQYLNLKTSQLIDVHATTFVIKDQKTGVPLYFANVSLNITERKQAEEALKESEEKFRNLIETMPEGFYRSTPEGYFVDVNPAFIKMLGYDSKEELMKVNIPNELYFTYNERIDGVTYNVDFIPDTEVYRLKKKDGSEIWVEDHSRYIQDISGKILYHEGIMRDFTESLHAQKAIIEAKEKAEEANRLKSSFLANMSHEIRTPLSGILGFADILKVELKDPAHIKYADIIEKSGNRLLETLDLILSFSKLEAEKEDAHYSNVRIEDVIDEVLKSFEAAAKNKNLFLKLSVQNKKLITYIDERFLRQIMNNLINNAIKYTDAGGITVNLLKENNNVVIKIIDTGIGIAKNKQEIIFQEFRQESEGHGRSFEGTGLGLAITKRFVELMKGKIEVESEVGIGSVFTVKFPYKNAPETITIKIKKEKPKKEIIMPVLPDKDKLSVLLVENDMMNLDFTVTVLNEYYNIETAVDGPEAIEKAKNKIHDIILMDINLGKGMDGIEAVRKIRKLPGYAKTPVVALTAFTLPGDREEFIAGGCTHYLGKPFTRIQMLELLKNITDKI